MPRVALSMEQKRDNKLKGFKGWVKFQIHLYYKTQVDVGRALGISRLTVSQMLKVPDKKDEKIKPDPFIYGQVLTLCEFFGQMKKKSRNFSLYRKGQIDSGIFRFPATGRALIKKRV